MKRNEAAAQLHEKVDWLRMRPLRTVEGIGQRALEALKGIRAAGVEDFISATLLHQVIDIESGRRYSSNPSNISAALKRVDGSVEKRQIEGALRFRFPHVSTSEEEVETVAGRQPDNLLLQICERFHRAVDHLSHRRKGRKAIEFSDEYDVQDVFGTVLKSIYDNVRDEEWTPSYAGHSARIDFVVVDIRTAVELKRARSKQEIADELIVDIARYANSANVDRLVCFVYDPEGILRRDAAQIESDLGGIRTHNARALEVTVIIRPK